MATDKTTIHCPLCGNAVAPGVTKCPVCATDLEKTISRRKTAGKESAPKADYLHRELPKVELPKASVTCPQCALQLQGGEGKCPRCGIPLAGEKEMLECPQCGGLAPKGSRSCPNCGIGFEEAPQAPPAPPATPAPAPVVPEELPPPPEPAEPAVTVEPTPEVVTEVPAVAKAPVYGLTNGRGAVNGTGLTNGRGAVNGTGLVNGTGMTNGTRMEDRVSAPSPRHGEVLRRWQFLAVLIALAVIVPTFVFLSYSGGSETAIDGDFDEWSDVNTFGVALTADSPNVAVDEWAVKTDDAKLYLYISVQGDVMASTEVDSFFLFVDSDNDAGTGYLVAGMGADYQLEMDGWDGSVQSTALKEYSSDDDQYDWNSWVRTDSLAYAIGGSELEAMALMPSILPANSKYMLQSQNNLATQTYSISHPVPQDGGVLVIRQEYGVGVNQADSTIAPASSVAILHLVLSCEGSSGHVTSIVPVVTGANLVGQIGDIDLSYGGEHELDVYVDSSLASAGNLVAAYVTDAGISSSFSDVRIIGGGVRAYVASPPPSIQIDGAFGDWEGLTTADYDSVSNPNVDISAVGAVNATLSSYFYVSVVGEMCSGSYVPIIVSKPVGGGGGGIVIPTKKTGEDIMRVYVDSDMDVLTGYPLSIVSKTIGAEYKVEIKGLDGIIQSGAIYQYSSGDWVLTSSVVNAENDYSRMEIGVPAAAFGGSSDIDFIIETTDWRETRDYATAVPSGVRAISSFPDPGLDRWIVDGSTSSGTATAESHQRKLFFDGVNFWSFFYDGANTVYKYSSDNGVTWTLVGNAFSSASITRASVWYYGPSNLVYIIGDSTASTATVHVRKGTVDPATHTITWSGNDATPTVSTLTVASKNTYISRDSSGYLWIVATNYTQTSPNRYELTVFRSANTDDVTSWVHTGSLLAGGIAQPTSKGSVVNIGSGSVMLAVYGSNGNVASRTYTTGWSAETVIYAVGGGNPDNTANSPPVVVVDGSGIAHVIYGDGHQQPSISKPYIYYVNFNGTAWSVPYRMENVANNLGNCYPTLSVDSSTGNLYAFWIEMDTAGIGITVMGKVRVGGTWTALTFDPQTTAPKAYLNSVYSAPGATYICWQWTQNTTTPIQVVFDKIPEFETVLLPAFGMVLILFAAIRRSRRKEMTG